MKKLLCVPIVMCFSLLLLQLAANILSFSLCLCPEFLWMSRMAKEQSLLLADPTRNASMHTNFFASQNVSCKRNALKFYNQIRYFASGLWHRLNLQVGTSASYEYTASVFRLDAGDKFPKKYCYQPTGLHCFVTQYTTMWIFTAERTTDLTIKQGLNM